MMDWKQCNDNKMVKKVSEDLELIKSLKISSNKSFQSAGRLKLDNITATSVISLYYDSLREVLEALAISKGYKVYNHECYCAFLKEIIKDEDIGNNFDKFRKIRNKIKYYGKDISSEDAKDIIQELKETIKGIQQFIK
ncbi:MAG: hypothetical protein ABIH53_00020 [archaeon]